MFSLGKKTVHFFFGAFQPIRNEFPTNFLVNIDRNVQCQNSFAKCVHRTLKIETCLIHFRSEKNIKASEKVMYCLWHICCNLKGLQLETSQAGIWGIPASMQLHDLVHWNKTRSGNSFWEKRLFKWTESLKHGFPRRKFLNEPNVKNSLMWETLSSPNHIWFWLL